MPQDHIDIALNENSQRSRIEQMCQAADLYSHQPENSEN